MADSKVSELYSAAKPPSGGKVQVRLNKKRETRDDAGKVVHTKPEYQVIDVETRQPAGPGDVATVYRSQYDAHPDMGELLGDAETPEREPAKKPKAEK